MRFSSKPLAAVALVGLVNIALAQDIAQPAAMAADVSAPGIRTVAEMVQLSGQVVSVNMETREVLVEGPNGNQVTLTAGDEIKNLAAVTPGDIVTAEVARTITLKLLKNSHLEVGRVEAVQQGAAPITEGEALLLSIA
jgi:3-hydroxymyristoyl/3-hydroxydecanoyl-(acyl carrier protein) dehydratase